MKDMLLATGAATVTPELAQTHISWPEVIQNTVMVGDQYALSNSHPPVSLAGSRLD